MYEMKSLDSENGNSRQQHHTALVVLGKTGELGSRRNSVWDSKTLLEKIKEKKEKKIKLKKKKRSTENLVSAALNSEFRNPI